MVKEMVYGPKPFQDIDHFEAVTNYVKKITPDMRRSAVGEITRSTIVCMEIEEA